MVFMGLFVLAGVPFVSYLWETLNYALALKPVADRLLIAVPILLLFAGLLFLLTTNLNRIVRPPNNSDNHD